MNFLHKKIENVSDKRLWQLNDVNRKTPMPYELLINRETKQISQIF